MNLIGAKVRRVDQVAVFAANDRLISQPFDVKASGKGLISTYHQSEKLGAELSTKILRRGTSASMM